MDLDGYLAFLAEGGASSAQIERTLDSLRLAFDTLALYPLAARAGPPRAPRTLPVPLEPFEVVRLIWGAPSLLDKLMLGLMYATASSMREVCQLRWSDVDLEKQVISIWHGRRRRRVEVRIPVPFAPLIRRLAKDGSRRRQYLFRAQGTGPPLASEGFGVFVRAAAISGVHGPVSSTTLRRSFATHVVANEWDLRFVDALFERTVLTRTVIYVPVKPRHEENDVPSALGGSPIQSVEASIERGLPDERGAVRGRAAVELKLFDRTVSIHDVRIEQQDPGWVILDLPPFEDWRVKLGDADTVLREALLERTLYREVESRILRGFLDPTSSFSCGTPPGGPM